MVNTMKCSNYSTDAVCTEHIRKGPDKTSYRLYVIKIQVKSRKRMHIVSNKAVETNIIKRI